MTTIGADLPAILLVHGFWHGSWCWADVAARLASAGRRVLAVDLAGHGLRGRRPVSAGARPFDAGAFAAEVSPIASVDLDEAGALLAAQIAAFAGGEPVIVAVHSAGGPVLTRAAQAVPHLVRHAVDVAAFMPATDCSAVSYLQEPEQAGDLLAPLFLGDPTTTGAVRLDVGNPGDYRQALRGAFYADVADHEADAAIALLTPAPRRRSSRAPPPSPRTAGGPSGAPTSIAPRTTPSAPHCSAVSSEKPTPPSRAIRPPWSS